MEAVNILLFASYEYLLVGGERRLPVAFGRVFCAELIIRAHVLYGFNFDDVSATFSAS